MVQSSFLFEVNLMLNILKNLFKKQEGITMTTSVRDKYRFVYEIQKAKHIRSKGIEFITRAKHDKTNSIFYLFEYTPEFQKAADEWDFMKILERTMKKEDE